MAEVKERRAKLFVNGRNKAVRIPREFEFDTDDVIIRQVEGGLEIKPAPKENLQDVIMWMRSLPPEELDGEFPEIEDLPADPVTVFDDWNDDEFGPGPKKGVK